MTPARAVVEAIHADWLRCRCSLNGHSAVDCLTDRIETLLAERERAIANLYEEYLAFLKKANEGPISFAIVHGWRCPDEDVERGKAYRAKIAAALAQKGEA